MTSPQVCVWGGKDLHFSPLVLTHGHMGTQLTTKNPAHQTALRTSVLGSHEVGLYDVALPSPKPLTAPLGRDERQRRHHSARKDGEVGVVAEPLVLGQSTSRDPNER